MSEHQRQGFVADSLSQIFASAQFWNAITAIGAGIVAQFLADAMPLTQSGSGAWYGGYCSPFDLSAVVLVGALFLISSGWKENYGMSNHNENDVVDLNVEDGRPLVPDKSTNGLDAGAPASGASRVQQQMESHSEAATEARPRCHIRVHGCLLWWAPLRG